MITYTNGVDMSSLNNKLLLQSLIQNRFKIKEDHVRFNIDIGDVTKEVYVTSITKSGLLSYKLVKYPVYESTIDLRVKDDEFLQNIYDQLVD